MLNSSKYASTMKYLLYFPVMAVVNYFYGMQKGVLYIVIACMVLGGIWGGMGCRKVQTLTQGGVLKFSVDTLAFDTVFTAEGSYTNSFVIYNPQRESVVVSSIRMQNGAASYFHLNV